MKTILSVFILCVMSTLGLFAYANNNGENGTDGTYQFGEGGFWGQTTVFNPDVPDAENFEGNVVGGEGESGANSLLKTVRTAINWVLGLLAFIALLFLLRGGFKILTAGTDEGEIDNAKIIVKNAAFGILFIALSWIIVTFIFYIAGILTEDNSTEGNAIGSEEPVGVTVP